MTHATRDLYQLPQGVIETPGKLDREQYASPHARDWPSCGPQRFQVHKGIPAERTAEANCDAKSSFNRA